MKRAGGRFAHQLRPFSISYECFGYADGAVLLSMGNTKVLCAVTLQTGVPAFLKGKRTGWLTAEYALMPTSTHIRSQRESAQKYNGRSVEIARLIGRTLRTVVDLNKLGERTITIDCDVLQADGGTRTACITGAFIALRRAVAQWLENGLITESIIIDELAAISAGVKDGHALLDIDYAEDSAIDADYNFIFTRSGNIVEIQGTTESKAISWPLFNEMCSLALQGVQELFVQIDAYEQKLQDMQKTVFIPSVSQGLSKALKKHTSSSD